MKPFERHVIHESISLTAEYHLMTGYEMHIDSALQISCFSIHYVKIIFLLSAMQGIQEILKEFSPRASRDFMN